MSPEQSNLAPAIAKRRHWSIPHILAVALAIAVYFLIYSITGDSDLFPAIATGAAGGAVVWIGLEVEYWFRRRSGA
ncbi:MAG TPA: hypothetical protein VHT03_13035 [Rhizomicrobium sp.]|jgi:hypothetical protein|nr:hypothetical protein [Rhizomicrobium sp.]